VRQCCCHGRNVAHAVAVAIILQIHGGDTDARGRTNILTLLTHPFERSNLASGDVNVVKVTLVVAASFDLSSTATLEPKHHADDDKDTSDP
jgi:hypothetical protein